MPREVEVADVMRIDHDKLLRALQETLDQREAAYEERDRARAAAVALEQECAVLTDTLALLTHEYDPIEALARYCQVCTSRVDDPRHRTPVWLRKRHGLGI